MKTSKLFGALVLVLTFLFTANVAFASTAVSAKETRKEVIKKVVGGQGDQLVAQMSNSKTLKKATRLAKFLGVRDANDKVDFQAEPDRWMWFWLLGWGVGLALSIMSFFIPFIGYLAYLCWLAGTVCLVIWLLKKTGNM
jgi:hypothetical protein